MAYSTFDRQCMTRALALAAKALCTTSPNPAVGCVIAREERVTAEGFTRPAGGNHAEIEALQQAPDSRGSTVYVTLEP